MRLFSDTFGETCKRIGEHPLPDHLDGRRGFGLAARRRLRTCTLAKLSSLKPTLGSLPPAIGRLPGREAYERERRTVSWRNWYKLARWARLRMRVFERDLFTCQWPGCGRIEGDTSLLVADHRRPHRGDEALFWDETNIQTLCKPCHDGAKQRQERRER